MHELSIIDSVLEAALECSAAHGGRAIVGVTLHVGANRHVVPELLQFAFEAATRDSPAAGARLHYREIPLLAWCRGCLEHFEPQDVFWECPRCGAFDACLVQGDELIMQSVELGDDEPRSRSNGS